MKFLLFWCFLIDYLVTFSLESFAQTPFCSGNVCLTVQVDNTSTSALITIQGPPNAGWVGVGIGTQMKNADVWVFWKGSNGSAVLLDGYATAHSKPTVDPVQNLQLISSSFNPKPTVTFRRKLDTGDSHDNPLILGSNNFIWATCNSVPSSSNINSAYSQHDNFGTFSMNIVQGSGQSGKGSGGGHPVVAHGLLMFISWAVAAPIGIMVARFLKPLLGVWWFRAHIVLMGAVVILLTTIAYFLMFTSSLNHLDNLHKVIGILVFIGVLLEGTLGIVIDRLFDPHRKYIPWFDKLHWWTGRCLLAGGLLNIYFGLSLAGASIYFKVFYGVWLLCLFGLFFMLQFRMGQTHHNDIDLTQTAS